MTAYAELQITSNFSFLRGGSHPEELVLRAAELGLSALALTDRNTLAGVVRAHVAAKEVGIRFVVGARLDLMPEDGADSSATHLDRRQPRPSSLIGLGRRQPQPNALIRLDRRQQLPSLERHRRTCPGWTPSSNRGVGALACRHAPNKRGARIPTIARGMT